MAIESSDGGKVPSAAGDVLQRREYFREKQRSHRLRAREEYIRLQKQLAEFEEVVRRRRSSPALPPARKPDSDTALSWQVVAASFRDEVGVALTENARLSKALRTQRRLLARMQMWVIQSNPVPFSVKMTVPWRKVQLTDDVATRSLAKQWAIQQMFHNTTAAFHTFPLLSAADMEQEFSIVDIAIDDSAVNTTTHSQYVWDAPLEVASDMLMHHMDDLSRFDPTVVSTEWEQGILLLQVMNTHGAAMSMLTTRFDQPDRSVIVLRQVECSNSARVSSGMPATDQQSLVWFDLRRLRDGRTLSRMASLSSIKLTEGGPDSIEGLARRIGLDLTGVTEDDRAQVLRKASLERSGEIDLDERRHIREVLARVQARRASSSH